RESAVERARICVSRRSANGARSTPAASRAGRARGPGLQARLTTDMQRLARSRLPGDGEAQQLVLGQVPVWAQHHGLLVVDVGRLLVVDALVGDGAVEVGLGRIAHAQLETLGRVGDAVAIAVLEDVDRAAVHPGLA